MDPDGGVAVHEFAGGVRLVELVGELDLSNREVAGRALGGDTPIIVDLTRATFVDTTILGALLRAATEKMVVAVCPNGTRVRRALDIMGGVDLLPMAETREDALSVFGIGDGLRSA